MLRLGYCFWKEPKNTSERSTVSSVTFLCALRITCYCFAHPGCTSQSDCKRLAHTNPACYLALSQLGRAEFTDTNHWLHCLRSHTGKRTVTAWRRSYTLRWGVLYRMGKKELWSAKVFFASSLQAGGAGILHSSQTFVSEHRKSGTRARISQTCSGLLGKKLHIQYMLLLSIFSHIHAHWGALWP